MAVKIFLISACSGGISSTASLPPDTVRLSISAAEIGWSPFAIAHSAALDNVALAKLLSDLVSLEASSS